jgi:hypothetical protein
VVRALFTAFSWGVLSIPHLKVGNTSSIPGPKHYEKNAFENNLVVQETFFRFSHQGIVDDGAYHCGCIIQAVSHLFSAEYQCLKNGRKWRLSEKTKQQFWFSDETTKKISVVLSQNAFVFQRSSVVLSSQKNQQVARKEWYKMC